jgi:hypothetical protein
LLVDADLGLAEVQKLASRQHVSVALCLLADKLQIDINQTITIFFSFAKRIISSRSTSKFSLRMHKHVAPAGHRC